MLSDVSGSRQPVDLMLTVKVMEIMVFVTVLVTVLVWLMGTIRVAMGVVTM